MKTENTIAIEPVLDYFLKDYNTPGWLIFFGGTLLMLSFTPKDQLNRTRQTNSSMNPKITKRAITQSERSTARTMKKRQLQQDQIATKRANNTSNSRPSPAKTQLKKHDVQVAVATYVAGTYVATYIVDIETLQANPKLINQNKQSKTHFRKTKRIGRV